MSIDVSTNYMSKNTIFLDPSHVVFGRVTYPAGATLGPRMQDGLQLVGIESGQASIAVDGKRCALPARSMCLLLPGRRELFHFAKTQTTCHNWCTLYFENIPNRFNDKFSGLPFSAPMTPLMESLVEWGCQAHGYPTPSSQQLSIHLAQSLFYAWLAGANVTTDNAPNPSAVALVQQYIAQHYAQPILMEDLAQVAQMSVNHLTRLFNLHLHITPSRYLWQYRTQRGIDLLRHTSLNVSQIASRVGFATPFHFSRRVKQMHCLSPRALREKR